MSQRIELIPAIDIIGGRCVRLTEGDYGRATVYSGSPLDMARRFEAIGYRRLHVVDLDGAKSKHVVNIDTLRAIAGGTSLEVDFGGGIKTDADMAAVMDAGAAMATVGSVAATSPELLEGWMARYGADRMILGADAKGGRIAIGGWKEDAGIGLLDFIGQWVAKGITRVLCTDISKDGTLAGPATELYKQIMAAHPGLRLIASGGVASADDIRALDAAGIPAVVFGKAIYEGRIDMEELWAWHEG